MAQQKVAAHGAYPLVSTTDDAPGTVVRSER